MVTSYLMPPLHVMSEGEISALLTKGGISIDSFKSSAKSFDEFLTEVRDKEVKLYLDQHGRVCRLAETVRIVARIASTGECIREIKRVYQNGKVVVRGPSAFPSETRIRGELLTSTAIRCLSEEFGIVITEEQVMLDPMMLFDTHNSSVFPPGIVTVNLITVANVLLRTRPWEEDPKVLNDKGVELHVTYTDPANPALEKLIEAL